MKDRNKEHKYKKEKIKDEIMELYHESNGVSGYRMICDFLTRKGYEICPLTVHKYMNKELRLFSIARRRKPEYVKERPNKIFENLLKRDFTAEKINQKWCMDFTYVFLSDGSVRYNCSIIDLKDRSIVASITDREITADLAIRTVKKAIEAQKNMDTSKLILHTDQGSQFTSKAFTDFCASLKITQSMSSAGCPYDNAPMERYFNTLKNELIYLFSYKDEAQLYKVIEEFAYVYYNHKRPHSYNNHKTPFEARFAL